MDQDVTWHGGRPRPRWRRDVVFSRWEIWLSRFISIVDDVLWPDVDAQSSVVQFFGRPFVKRLALCNRTIVCPVCLSVCYVGVLWPNGWMDQGKTWYAGRPQPRPHCVRWGPSSSFPHASGAQQPPIFDHVYCGQTVARLSYWWTLVKYIF